jgi:hypothetical protein
MNSACKTDPTWRYRDCIPMDLSDFDVDRHVIPFSSSSVTPAKKRMKRDPEQFSPDQVCAKPSCRSKRSECDKRLKESTKRFFQCKVDSCVSEDVISSSPLGLFVHLQ